MNNGIKGTIVNPDTIYGKSAYEIAVMHGFDGTEEEWIKGEQIAVEAAARAEEAANRLENMYGDIETALDTIIAIQESLIGGDTV